MIKIGNNQFIFTKTEPADIEFDIKLKLGDYNIFLGSGCRTVHAFTDDRELLILGYITDAVTGELSESELAKKLLTDLRTDCENIVECFSGAGGRFVCFTLIEGKLFVWNDTCGLKQLFYDTASSGGTICAASQARYIARLKGYEPDAAAVEYLTEAKKQPEFSMPLSASIYKNVSRLLPNHFLADDGQPQRRMKAYNINCSGISENRRVELIADMLKNGSRSASKIFKPSVSLTGGLDSRLALTAFSGIKQSLDVFTLKYVDMPGDHYDLVIPKQFCERFGYNHRVIECREPSAEYAAKYRAHSEHPHEYWIQMSEAVDKESNNSTVVVKGSCNEIVQYSNGVLPDADVTSEIICRLFEIPQTEFSLEIIGSWLGSAADAAKEHNIPLLSLFYWEHRMGSWFSACLNEGDVSSEVFSPFNVRKLLALMASFPLKTRIPPHFELFVRLMEECEKGSSEIEINPGRYSKATSKLKLFIKYKMPFLYKIAIMMSGRM